MSDEGRREKRTLKRTIKGWRITMPGMIFFLLIVDVLLLLYRIVEDFLI